MTDPSCMASSNADCVLGGVRLISSARMMFAKIGPLTNTRSRLPVRPVFFDDFRSRNIRRHQVRRELDTFEVQMQDLGDGRDQQCLGQTGHAGDDGVAAGQHRNHHLIDDLFLSDDDFPNFSIDLL